MIWLPHDVYHKPHEVVEELKGVIVRYIIG